MISSKKFLNEFSEKNKKGYNNQNDTVKTDIDEFMSEDKILNDFKEQLLNVIANMTSKKFETFSRTLLIKMGVKFIDIGVQISNDGGIDGYGYHKDLNDFKRTRAIIQCKRYNTGPVIEPDIN